MIIFILIFPFLCELVDTKPTPRKSSYFCRNKKGAIAHTLKPSNQRVEIFSPTRDSPIEQPEDRNSSPNQNTARHGHVQQFFSCSAYSFEDGAKEAETSLRNRD